MSDDIATLFALGLGPWLTPLRGKVPVLDAWPTLPPVDEAKVRDWVETGYNLGLRTGSRSGVIVVDDDRAKHGETPYTAPPTGLVVATPSGGRHYYYRAPTQCPGNTASKLAPHVDTRGEGGQVVVPPSIHPVDRTAYRFVSTGEPGPWPVAHAPAPPATPRGTGYADTALAREVHAVRTAPEGQRNDTLNKAAYNAGQLVAGGALDQSRVESELLSAAGMAGLSEREARATIASGIRAGAKAPRTVPTRPERAPAQRPRQRPDVLVPGPHTQDGSYTEQGTDDFAEQALSAVDPDALYRRAGVLGQIHDATFAPVETHQMRTIVDASVRLIASRLVEDRETVTYRPCSYDLASVVMGYGRTRGQVRDLRYLATHPVCVGRDFDLARPGWNPDHGVYLVGSVPEPLDLATARAVLDDLLADFPFQSAADRDNFLGLMMTPILRPAVNEPVPMHLIASPMPRTGKTKLAEIVLGCAVGGKRTPAMQLGDREEEREKRILSVLVRGQTLLHLDNIKEFIDSPALASLLTSSEYQGRMLGSSSAPSVPNGLTIVGTGNNVHATDEIAKRIVPVRLMPSSESPESRTDFRHPDLLGYVTANRDRILGALLGLVEHWRASGRALSRIPLGGFERWAACVGGILESAGYDGWLTNLAEWRGEVDSTTCESTEFVALWSRLHGTDWVESVTLFKLASDNDIFGWLDRYSTDRARRTSFGMRVLNRLANQVVAVAGVRYRVEVDGIGARRQARLAIVSTLPT